MCIRCSANVEAVLPVATGCSQRLAVISDDETMSTVTTVHHKSKVLGRIAERIKPDTWHSGFVNVQICGRLLSLRCVMDIQDTVTQQGMRAANRSALLDRATM